MKEIKEITFPKTEEISKLLRDGKAEYERVLSEIARKQKALDEIDLDLLSLETIEGKDALNKVHVEKQALVKMRTSISKQGVEIRRPFNEFSKGVKEVYDNVEASITFMEGHPAILKMNQLKQENLDRVAAEKAAQEEAISSKLSSLLEIGFICDGEWYVHNSGLSISRMIIAQMGDTEWETFYAKGVQAQNIVLEALRSEERKAETIEQNKYLIVKEGLNLTQNNIVVNCLETSTVKVFEVDLTNDQEVDRQIKKAQKILESNKALLDRIAAIKQQQKEEEEYQMKAKKAIEESQIKMYGKLLTDVGMTIEYGSSKQTTYFKFSNTCGIIKIVASDLLLPNGQSIVESTIEQVANYRQEEEKASAVAAQKAKEDAEIAEKQRIINEQEKLANIKKSRLKSYEQYKQTAIEALQEAIILANEFGISNTNLQDAIVAIKK
jgi:hypothetical protein